MVERQRDLIRFGPLVMEGRDIGTVVFPSTPYKFYLDATPGVRAERRRREMHGESDDVLASISMRDRKDSSRPVSPLRRADDAETIDTSGMDLDEVVRHIEESLRRLGAPAGQAP